MLSEIMDGAPALTVTGLARNVPYIWTAESLTYVGRLMLIRNFTVLLGGRYTATSEMILRVHIDREPADR